MTCSCSRDTRSMSLPLHGRRALVTGAAQGIGRRTAEMFAAAGYSLVYLLAGGGFFGAFVIFVIAKMMGR